MTYNKHGFLGAEFAQDALHPFETSQCGELIALGAAVRSSRAAPVAIRTLAE